MQILLRARDIILNPRETWQKIKGEEATIKGLYLNYAAPLALIPAVSGLIGITLFGMRMPTNGMLVRLPFLHSLPQAIAGYAINLVAIYIIAWVVKFLAPRFNSKQDMVSAMKLVVYSATPGWLAGIFSIIPVLGFLSIVGLYGIYLMVLGLPALLNTPSDKVAVYTISIIFVGFAASMIMGLVVGAVFFAFMGAPPMTV